jgi:hypothetical protein
METSKETCDLIENILQKRDKIKLELQNNFPKLPILDVLNAVFAKPYFRLSDFMRFIPNISEQTARKYLHLLVRPYKLPNGDVGRVLTMEKIGRENIYFNRTLFDILSGDK